jgi:predicted Fe-S protein YdhL (DUF1289 family)
MKSAASLLLERAHAVREATSPVPSPCVSVCRMDAASGLCEGCLRTLDEIGAWSRLGDEAKREVWSQLERRALVIDTHQAKA